MSRLALLLVAVLVLPLPAAASSDHAIPWDNYSESDGCGAPATFGPNVPTSGLLTYDVAVLGPYGSYFGRTIGDLAKKMTWWDVPGSDWRVRVHPLMLPALDQVAEGLAAHAAEGRVYPVDVAWGFTPRTINGRRRLSRHALGLAIDINPSANPYRDDPTLITDMPDWFVQVWRDAGFCWGGDWEEIKDPMHFSWMGPGATPDYPADLVRLPPATEMTEYDTVDVEADVVFAPAMDRYHLAIADANANGAPDVVGLRSHPDGAVIDVARGSRGYGDCSIGRWFVPELDPSAQELFAFFDVDGDSRQDLVTLRRNGGGLLTATVATRGGDFEDVRTSDIAAADITRAVAGGDYDGDGIGDLWALEGGSISVFFGPDFETLADIRPLPTQGVVDLTVADRVDDPTPEVFLLSEGQPFGRIRVFTHSGATWRQVGSEIDLPVPAAEVAAFGSVDYDGDGRPDLQVLTTDGTLLVLIGNTPTGESLDGWFTLDDPECSDVPVEWEGTFFDDDAVIFEADIEVIAAAGVTRGCNPPFNDRFCPEEEISRGQMAAFLARALDLPPTDVDHFGDDDGSIFEDDINRVAEAGITRGCGADRYCRGDPVTRGQMAAFLVRAYGYDDTAPSGFTDISTSIFREEIERLAAAGVTKGCAPDRYCPQDPVTRGQMAAFLNRAGVGE